MKKDEIIKEFENESEQVKSIVCDRATSNWKFLLAAELLESRLNAITRQYQGLDSETVGKRIDMTNENTFIDWSASLCIEIPKIMENISNKIIRDLQKAIGPVGKPGDALKIKNAVEEINDCCKQLLKIETDIRSIDPPHRFVAVRRKMEGFAFSWLNAVVRFKDNMKEVANDLASTHPRGDYDLILKFDTPLQISQLAKEIKKLKPSTPLATNTMSYSELRQKLFGEPQVTRVKSRPKGRTRSNVRSTVSIVSKILRLFR